MSSQNYDYVIVGGGIAGLVLAARLSENPEVQLLVLEAGEDQTSDPRVKTPALWGAMLKTSSDWGFHTVPGEALFGRATYIPQGKLLGGSSALNGLIFAVDSKSTVNKWAEFGNPGWNWEVFSKYLAKVYTLAPPSEEVSRQLSLGHISKSTYKASGPLQISFPSQPENEWPKVWLDTLAAVGCPLRGDPFSGEASGAFINAECVNAADKQRSYAASAYLEPARKRSNLVFITGANVEKIILDSSKPDNVFATGVQFTKDGETSIISARKEVILCAGALNSPKLLQLSGIGDPQVLRDYGIETVVDLPAVGENLQNHPLCSISFEVKEGNETMDGMIRKDPAFLASAAEQYKAQSGPFATCNFLSYAQLPVPGIETPQVRQEIEEAISKSDSHIDKSKADTSAAASSYSRIHRDYIHSVLRSSTEGSGCYIALPGHVAHAADGSMAPPPPGPEGYLSVTVLLAHPLSRGRVRLDRSAPNDLAVEPRLLSHPLDVEVLARHLQFAEGRIAAAEPLAGKLVRPPSGRRNAAAPRGPASFAGPDGLAAARAYIRRTAVGAHHYSGTCAMMARGLGGVVDERLRVYGCGGLRVCDASILPLVPRSNPQSSVYAAAEMAADLIRAG